MTDSDDLWVSCHLRCSDPDAVSRALRDIAGASEPVPVWPPVALQPGVLISPVRYRWVSLWGTSEPCDALMTGLTATLECIGIVFRLAEDECWWLSLFRHGYIVADAVFPPEDETVGSSTPATWDAAGGWLSSELRAALEWILPVGGSVEDALELVAAPVDRDDVESDIAFVEESLELFANYFGIRDAAWDPRQDYETFAAGDYEDLDEMPEGWREFRLAPFTHWQIHAV